MMLYLFFKGGPFRGHAVRVDVPDSITIRSTLRILGHEYTMEDTPTVRASILAGGLPTIGINVEHLGRIPSFTKFEEDVHAASKEASSPRP